MAVVKNLISLKVRASQASHLCFETGGIIGELNVALGTSVPAFDFAAFYAILGSIPTVPGHPARMLYDFLQIQAAVKPFTLVALRAEPTKTALNKAIGTRANAFYAKYANAPAIISRMTAAYSPSISGSKPNRLDIVNSVSEDQMLLLKNAYTSAKRTGVVQTTESIVRSNQESMGHGVIGVPMAFDLPADGGPPSTAKLPGTNPVSLEFQASNQKTVNTNYDYRVPALENIAQYERTQINLIDEQFSQFMQSQNLPYLTAVFANELNSINSDVYRLQIAYLNTILMSPIVGVVTGIYKDLGDAVRAGEPVVRVENNTNVLLIATLKFRGPISIGANFHVATTLFDMLGSPTPTNIKGSIVSVRGLREDDRWEVIAKCNNLNGGVSPILPLGYHFDYDTTTVTIT